MFLTMVDSNSGRSSLRKMSDGTEAARKKRYNVAASRAKNQMWVINSLDTDNDLKTGDIRKEFLEYVRNPKEISLYKKMEKKSRLSFGKGNSGIFSIKGISYSTAVGSRNIQDRYGCTLSRKKKWL